MSAPCQNQIELNFKTNDEVAIQIGIELKSKHPNQDNTTSEPSGTICLEISPKITGGMNNDSKFI